MLKHLVCILLTCVVLTACSSKQVTEENPKLFIADLLNDAPFPEYASYEIATPAEIFAIDDDMHRFITTKLLRESDPYARSKILLKELFNQSPTSLRYQNGANLTAIETFHKNTANCLSLTILAYTLADHAGLSINFQQVDIPEFWERNGNYNLLTRHVNLKITGQKLNVNKVIWGPRELVIDFDPYSVKKHFAKIPISRDRVIAMFYNNKGAQAFIRKEYDLAYAYFRQAVIQDDTFSSVWGNLGYLYKTMGLYDFAEKSYLMAINNNRKNYNAWNSLAILMRESERNFQAKAIQKRLDIVRKNNPYYHALLGDEAYHSGEFKRSIKHYKKAKSLNDSEDSFYFGIARAYYKLGDIKATELYLSKAKRHADFKDVRQLYQDKLNLFTQL